jgi:hypothetical protein
VALANLALIVFDMWRTPSADVSGSTTAPVEVLEAIPGEATLNVTGAGGAAASTTTASQATSNGGATIDPNAKPAPDWKPFDPHLVPAPGEQTIK